MTILEQFERQLVRHIRAGNLPDAELVAQERRTARVVMKHLQSKMSTAELRESLRLYQKHVERRLGFELRDAAESLTHITRDRVVLTETLSPDEVKE